jgi:hypothetical protein
MIGCQTASGVWFLIGYQTYFFTVCGITKAFEFSIMNTCFGFLGVNVGMYAISQLLGRRSILMLGAVACGLCQLATAVAATVSPNTLPTGQTLVAFTALFMFFLQRVRWRGELPRRDGVGEFEVEGVDGGNGDFVGVFVGLVGEFLYAVFY